MGGLIVDGLLEGAEINRRRRRRNFRPSVLCFVRDLDINNIAMENTIRMLI